MNSNASNETPKPVTLVLSYYESPRMLAHQLEGIERYDAETRRYFRLIVVDDGSPDSPAKIERCAVPFKVYRCLVDVPWNSIFCRNLGVSESETEWVVLTDMDHLVPAETARAIVHDAHSPETAYLFSRQSAPTLKSYKPHQNTFLMTRSLYDAVGGYDERLSGFYGNDFDFRRRLRARAPIDLLKEKIVRVPREVVADASTTRYPRKSTEERFRRTIQRDYEKQSTLRLTFPWERVK